ncbi:MAG: hypothetical protein HDKAJFGB_00191 [Anaerolineae bacterium]|nr:hypothetical protein [Anaerolineae bacterium]
MGSFSRTAHVSDSQSARRIYRVRRAGNERRPTTQVFEFARLADFFQKRYVIRIGFGKGRDSRRESRHHRRGIHRCRRRASRGFQKCGRLARHGIDGKTIGAIDAAHKTLCARARCGRSGRGGDGTRFEFGAPGAVVQKRARAGWTRTRRVQRTARRGTIDFGNAARPRPR